MIKFEEALYDKFEILELLDREVTLYLKTKYI